MADVSVEEIKLFWNYHKTNPRKTVMLAWKDLEIIYSTQQFASNLIF